MLWPYWEILREGSSPATSGQTSTTSRKPRMVCATRRRLIAYCLRSMPVPCLRSVRNRLTRFISLLGLIRDSLMSRLVDPELLHLGNQCCTFKSQPGGRSPRTAYHSAGIVQCLQDQRRFVFTQCALLGKHGDCIGL